MSGILLKRKRENARVWMIVCGPITALRCKNSHCHHLHGCVYAPNSVHNVLPGANLDDDGVCAGLEDEELHLHSYKTLFRELPMKLDYLIVRQYSPVHSDLVCPSCVSFSWVDTRSGLYYPQM